MDWFVRKPAYRHVAHWGLAALDIVVSLAAVTFAFVVRFAFDGKAVPTGHIEAYLRALPWILAVRALIYHAFGLYKQVWSLVSIPELARVAAAVSLDSLFVATVLLAPGGIGFARSVLLISWFCTLSALVSLRLFARIVREWRAMRAAKAGASDRAREKTLLFGAGSAGAMLAREMARHPELVFDVVGFVDDSELKQGHSVAGKPILGTRDNLVELVKRHEIKHVIIAATGIEGRVVREVMESCRELGVSIKTIPALYELVDGRVSVSQIREIRIEDLLGRPEVDLDTQSIADYLTDQVVLVTGAGGSIGSELCRQVARFGPKQLLLLGHGENSIYEIDLELRGLFPQIEIVPIIADIQDAQRIDGVFSEYRPDVVFHAAAHKHVPLMEQNPSEAIKNNVFGTRNVAEAASRHRVKRFVLISTDKAVSPTTVMGASKLAAEMVVHAAQQLSRETVFAAVRFGNVLGSRGSVVPLFGKQIRAGGPVTITDPEMTRYFMTIPEAAQLVIQAAALATGGEVFVLDMGKPVRIVDLAYDMIRLSGLEPGVDIQIVFTGVRRGEKLNEELFTPQEGRLATRHERVFVSRHGVVPAAEAGETIDALQELAVAGTVSSAAIVQSLGRTAATPECSSEDDAYDHAGPRDRRNAESRG